MALIKSKPAQGKGKVRGKLPTKRSINLVLVDENKINPVTAILGILLVLVLAAAFSKFLVIDRLDAMTAAQNRVNRLQTDLGKAMAALDEIGDVNQTYAHYTLEDMTAAERNLVDRVQVLSLVNSILPAVEEAPTEAEVASILGSLFRVAPATGNDALDEARQQARLTLMEQLVPVPEYTISKWSLTDNLLTVEVNGQTLERLNLLGQQIESSPIVDSCTIMTANKDERKKKHNQSQEGVLARFIVYLQKADPVPADEGADEASPGTKLPNFGAVTQFVGGGVSQSEDPEP